MGTENAGPFAAAPPAMTPFSSSGPGFRPFPPARFGDPSAPAPPPSFSPPTAGPYPTPQYPAGQVSSSPASFFPTVPMGSPPPKTNFAPPGMNFGQPAPESSFPSFQPSVPPIQSSYPGAIRGPLQPPLPGYASKQPNAAPRAPPVQAPFGVQQGGFAPAPPTSSPSFHGYQGGYTAPPPIGAPLGLHARGELQYPGSGPPTNSVQGLMEDFSSLSLGSVPDPGVDTKALPRPLEGGICLLELLYALLQNLLTGRKCLLLTLLQQA